MGVLAVAFSSSTAHRAGGVAGRIGSDRELTASDGVHRIHSRHAGDGPAVAENMNLHALVRDNSENRVENTGILPGAIYRKPNPPLHGIHRNNSRLREGQRVIIRREILKDEVCAIRDDHSVHQRVAEVQIGTLKIDGQIAQLIPCDVSSKVLQAAEKISARIDDYSADLTSLGIADATKEKRPRVEAWLIRNDVLAGDPKAYQILRHVQRRLSKSHATESQPHEHYSDEFSHVCLPG